MVFTFRLPDVGEGVHEGEVGKWFVKEGDEVRADQPLVEVLTDKVNVEIPSPASGVVLRIMAREGERVKVGEPLIAIGERGEKVEEAPTLVAERVAPPTAAQPPAQPPPRVLATPATRKLARELNVDLAGVTATGAGGRITDEDIRRFAAQVAVPRVEAVPTPETLEERIPLRGVRRIISDRMSLSKRTIPHVYNMAEVDATQLISLRERVKESAMEKGVKLTYLAFVVKAVVSALKEFPYFNSSVDVEKGEIVMKKYYNIGIATATEHGLYVPVVKDADKKNILTIAGEVQALAEKTRDGKLELHEVHGGTFTITSVGGVEKEERVSMLWGTPIINPPEVAILAVGKIQKMARVKDGEVKAVDTLPITLSYDHRVIDGYMAAQFLTRIMKLLEDPSMLLLEL